MTNNRDRVPAILNTVVDWAKSQPSVRGFALVGSHARHQARPDSDLDVLLLADNPESFRTSTWLADIAWSRVGARTTRWADEEYGAVWSRRIWLDPHCGIEVAFAPLRWADISPVDDGTRRVVSGGCRILHDPEGLLTRLVSMVVPHYD